jgi:hypothetical protein
VRQIAITRFLLYALLVNLFNLCLWSVTIILKVVYIRNYEWFSRLKAGPKLVIIVKSLMERLSVGINILIHLDGLMKTKINLYPPTPWGFLGSSRTVSLSIPTLLQLTSQLRTRSSSCAIILLFWFYPSPAHFVRTRNRVWMKTVEWSVRYEADLHHCTCCDWAYRIWSGWFIIIVECMTKHRHRADYGCVRGCTTSTLVSTAI